jgi:hypothetical protein
MLVIMYFLIFYKKKEKMYAVKRYGGIEPLKFDLQSKHSAFCFIPLAVRYRFICYCSCNQEINFSIDTDSITIGIELWSIPQISEHWPKKVPSLFIRTDAWLSLPG